ncbi:MOB2 family protein [Megaselia abdita]
MGGGLSTPPHHSTQLFSGLLIKARRKERDDQNSTDTKLYLEESVLERKLPDADLKALVDLPAGLDFNEWLASHTLALFEHVNLVYGTISEFCTPSGCPDMTGPGNRTYLWFDEKGKKTRVAAPQYIDYVMTFTQKTVSDESIFPTKYAKEFPSSFESIARKILRLQFHVIAHLYAAHFREIALLGLHTHLNLTFAHLTALHRRFNLIDEKETDVLRDLEVALRLTDDHQQLAATTTATTATDTSKGGDVKRIEEGGGVGGGVVDATMVKPICTQPESMKALSNSDGNNVNILGGGILGSFTANDLIANDSNSFNNGGTSHNNNMLQCNNITSSSQQQQQQQQQPNLLHNHQHHNHHSSNSSSPTPSTTTTTA